MRDKLKSKEYFDGFIIEDSGRVEKFERKLCTGEVKSERILAVKSKIHDLKLGILTAKYSRGDDVTTLKKEYVDLLMEWKEVFCKDYYNKNLKMVSMAVLFDVDGIHREIIDDILQDYGQSDWLITFLVNPKTAREDIPLLFEESFKKLKDVVYKSMGIEVLKDYLDNDWYCEDCGCYEAHKNVQNIYYGYWSFEAGAITKILELDDSILKDVSYYPYDLVHYKEKI